MDVAYIAWRLKMMGLIYQNDYVRIEQTRNDRIALKRTNPISVITLVQKGEQFLFIKQYRAPIDQYILQLPGGGVDKGENLEEAARRELREETGIICGHMEYFGKMYSSPWITNEECHVYFTDDIKKEQEQILEEHEQIEIVYIKIQDCFEGKNVIFEDAELAFALYQYFLRKMEKS